MKNIIVADTTLRDGTQAPGCRLTPAQKGRVARQLHKLGVDIIEAGFPVSSPAEIKAVKAIARSVGRYRNAPEIGGLARSIKSDIESCWNAIKEARTPRIHTFLATSDVHLKYKLHMTRDEAIRRAVEGVRIARRFTPNVQFSPEDAFRSDRRFLVKMLEAVIDAGASTVNVPDTVGYATPTEFGEFVSFLIKRVRNIRKAVVSVHCHNDLGMAVANSLMALKAGARQVEGTINGIGERAGNCSLEEAIMAIRTRSDYFGFRTRVKTTELTATSRLVSQMTGFAVPPNKAIVGKNAFAHASGIHQDGMLKNQRTYEIMRPESVGLSGSWLPLTARSGKNAIRTKLSEMGFDIDESQLQAVFSRFKELADRTALVSDKALASLID